MVFIFIDSLPYPPPPKKKNHLLPQLFTPILRRKLLKTYLISEE